MTTPEHTPPSGDTHVGLDLVLDDPSGQPVVVVKFTTGRTVFCLALNAHGAPQFMAQVAEAVAQGSQVAIAKMGPKLVVPPAAGKLIMPNGATPR